MDTQIITALINLAGGALGLALIQGIVKWLTGRYNAIQKAQNQYDTERRYSHDLYEHALILRRRLIRADITDLPDIPERK